jgi:hypothetical protein
MSLLLSKKNEGQKIKSDSFGITAHTCSLVQFPFHCIMILAIKIIIITIIIALH